MASGNVAKRKSVRERTDPLVSPYVRRAISARPHEYIPDPRFDDACRECTFPFANNRHYQIEDKP
jgi:hypothetical protein